MERSEDAAEAGMSNRWPEILVALFLFAMTALGVTLAALTQPTPTWSPRAFVPTVCASAVTTC